MIGSSQTPLPDNTQLSQDTGTHVPGGIRNRNQSKRAAADPIVRPRGHQGRPLLFIRYWHFSFLRRKGISSLAKQLPAEDSRLLACYAVSTAKQISEFWRSMMPPTSRWTKRVVSTSRQGAQSQKKWIFITTITRTSNLSILAPKEGPVPWS